jgi:hypothetical protein
MASRGIGGDDGPTLWMFIACILIWGKIQGWFNAASDKLSGNLANPLQPETTAQIKAKEAQVKKITYRSSNLTQKLDHYQQIADAQYKELESYLNVDEDRLIAMLKPLNKDELIAVYKCFGVRDSTSTTGGLLATGTGNIFDFYNEILTDSTFGGQDLTDMRKIWLKTGLWATV